MANLHRRKTERLLAEALAPSILCHDCWWALQLFKTLRVRACTWACVRARDMRTGICKGVGEVGSEEGGRGGAKGRRRRRLWSRARAQACSLRGRAQQMDRGGTDHKQLLLI